MSANDFGIVVKTYRNYVEYINFRNQLGRVMNQYAKKVKSKNDKRGMKVLHDHYLTRDCTALIEVGIKRNSTMLVKQVYNGYAFMMDEERVKRGFGNYGIWVERASHCSSLTATQPKINPHSLGEEVNKLLFGKKDFKVKPLNMEAWHQ
jgi:hypothetical protein